jgi:hypothetical protein
MLGASFACLLAAASASGGGHEIGISRSGHIGGLRLNVTTVADIERQWGPPGYTKAANVGAGDYPNYLMLGYGCHGEHTATVCSTSFFVSRKTRRLESFTTTSPDFVLFGNVHVGMSGDVAARREHQPDEAGCGQGINVSTHSLSVVISTEGGKLHGQVVSGGRVVGIAIDDKPYGVGVLFC